MEIDSWTVREILTTVTKSSVAAHTAVQESQSAGSKIEQDQEEGTMPDQEQQRCSCLSVDTFY